MSLLSSYSSANKVDQNSLCIRYSVAYVVDSVANYYRVTRTASRNYSYIGMTKTAADTCAAAKLAQYTRTYYSLASSVASGATTPAQISRTETGATVSTFRGDGESWGVSISVSETDTRASATAPTDLDALFAVENARNYDDAFKAYTFELSGGGGSASVSSDIPGFSPSSCVVQGKVDAQDEWSEISASWSGSTFTYDASYNFVRAIYGSYESNTIS